MRRNCVWYWILKVLNLRGWSFNLRDSIWCWWAEFVFIINSHPSSPASTRGFGRPLAARTEARWSRSYRRGRPHRRPSCSRWSPAFSRHPAQRRWAPPSPCHPTLVERFDIEPLSDFAAKWSNFIGLVLFCIDAKFYKKIFVGKLLTRSTRFTCFCTAQTSIFQQNFVKNFRIFRQFFQRKNVILQFF